MFPNEDKCRVLLCSYVLLTLHKCFLSDNGQFVTKERFDSLLQPLTDQVGLQRTCIQTDKQTDRRTH